MFALAVTQALVCAPEERRSIVSVDLRRMNRVLWVEPENGRACVEAGATGREIDAQLAEYGLMIGHEPDSYELSTLGGWIATNAGCMKRNRYGNIADLVLGLTVVTADGVLRREQAPARESTGGDPARWLIGSEGRLGIVTSATVKVFPRPACKRFGSLSFPDFEAGAAFMHDVQRSGLRPASIRLMDNVQFQLGQALRPATRSALARARHRLERVYVERVRRIARDRLAVYTLLFEGGRDEVAAQQRSIYALAAKHRAVRAGAENGRRGYGLTFAIAYIRDFLNTQHIIAESFEASAPWTQCVSLVDRVKRRVERDHQAQGLPWRPLIGARLSQIYDTGACVYFYFGFYAKGVPHALEAFEQIERAAREAILRSGGSLSDHHGVGRLRQRFLPQIYS